MVQGTFPQIYSGLRFYQKSLLPLLALTLLAVLFPRQVVCFEESVTLHQETLPEWEVKLQVKLPKQKKIPLNRLFSMDVQIEGKHPSPLSLVSVDARMPDHNHGMMTKPKVSIIDSKNYRVKGMKMHMRGQWQIKLTMSTPRGNQEVNIPVHL